MSLPTATQVLSLDYVGWSLPQASVEANGSVNSLKLDVVGWSLPQIAQPFGTAAPPDPTNVVYIKTGASTWSTATAIYIKTASSTWNVINEFSVKTSSGWNGVGDNLYSDVTWSSDGSLVTSNLVLLLDANAYSGSGNWLDTSGSNNYGVITSSNSTLTYVNDGDADYFNFGSGTNRFVMNSGMFNPNQDHTFSIWIRFDDWSEVSNSTMQSFLAEDDTSGGILYRYAQNYGGHDGLQLVRSYQSNKGSFSNTTGLSHSTIYNFTFTRSGSTFTCYINGVNTHPSTGNTIGTITSSDTTFITPNNIGSDKNGVDDLEARVYHVMAYSDALTSSEVLSNFNALKARYGY
tara:strand:+ start:229 stop:1272 length:1044 start_codon:yes stop_codon:yes gene_type:complete